MASRERGCTDHLDLAGVEAPQPLASWLQPQRCHQVHLCPGPLQRGEREGRWSEGEVSAWFSYTLCHRLCTPILDWTLGTAGGVLRENSVSSMTCSGFDGTIEVITARHPGRKPSINLPCDATGRLLQAQEETGMGECCHCLTLLCRQHVVLHKLLKSLHLHKARKHTSLR